jgi:hypothetical protein
MNRAISSPSPTETRETLAGLVERVTFHNEENCFCVLRVKARGKRELITVTGHAAVISAGEFIQASGNWSPIPWRSGPAYSWPGSIAPSSPLPNGSGRSVDPPCLGRRSMPKRQSTGSSDAGRS